MVRNRIANKKLIDRFEFRFIILITLIGFFISRRETIQFFNSLSPFEGLIIWYLIFALFLHLLLRGVTLRIDKAQITKWGSRETLASLLLVFAFFIVFNFGESEWANYGQGGLPSLLIQTEDGVIFRYLYQTLGNPDVAAFLTYVIVPLILTLIAAVILAPGRMRKLVLRLKG